MMNHDLIFNLNLSQNGYMFLCIVCDEILEMKSDSASFHFLSIL